MIETPLDDCVAYGFQAVPGYSTQIVTLDNGAEQRNGNWTRAKRRYTALFQNFTKAEFAILLAAFHAARGSLYAFLFKDHFDYQATLESQGTTPGANLTPVQLRKTYTFGATSIVRSITKPIAGTVTMYQDNGSGTFVAKAGTFSTTTGLFTPNTNWTAGRALKATFEFYVPVRFAFDEFPSSFDDIDAINTNAELVEVFGE
jgi:uncharacterized protein (TIGR02217 family)